MPETVTFTTDAASVLNEARAFLASEPVLHNVVLTLLTERASVPQDGRYWVAKDGGDVVGVVFQSPLTFSCSLPCMAPGVIVAMVDAVSTTVADQGVPLPGAIGEVSTVARFAGQWTERNKSGAAPTGGQRIYEIERVEVEPKAPGVFRAATLDDRELVTSWVVAFAKELDEPVAAPASGAAPQAPPPGRGYWLWDVDGTPVSLASASQPVEGVVRVGPVYTPPEQRRRGYAEACVAEVSRRVLAGGSRCILYTDLGNATSNSIYRRIGYRSVAEVLRYRFS
jgi:GNAT superfamily N-acetyltransferase